MSTLSSAELQLLRMRDSEYLMQLFQQVNPFLLRFLYGQKINSELAHDLVQESWRIFFEKIEQFKGQSSVRTFVTGILVNKLREHRRAQRREVQEEDLDRVVAQAFSDEGWWQQEPRGPYDYLNSKEILIRIEQCMQGLSPSQNEAFVLKEVYGNSTEEICNILDVSNTHLGVLLFRAKEKLRQCLEGALWP